MTPKPRAAMLDAVAAEARALDCLTALGADGLTEPARALWSIIERRATLRETDILSEVATAAAGCPRLRALALAVSPTPRPWTQDEKMSFRRAWDARVTAALDTGTVEP